MVIAGSKPPTELRCGCLAEASQTKAGERGVDPDPARVAASRRPSISP